ncbi:hypothetical protein JAAARDRAFT_65757 [Jaapia argillacea MUCL 33604]|uniref:Uncharacterized protein n=1 Tax=Jaapia argillacea MUCL 33604 TaxID=933084 RepID=A0A067QC66_9AGAM|nr:hypothetical protein JAAARDRAFT_65757 [Jaapia argillacea MUCL 33604]
MFVSLDAYGVQLSSSKFDLSNDKAINFILAEIPFFAIGVLVVATFTFFVVLNRATLCITFLHASGFLAFIAVILDLSQVLNRGLYNTDHDLDLNSVNELLVAREIFFAISASLRFLFFWAFISERPPGETSTRATPEDRRPNFLTFNSEATMHNGSWHRWGIVGILLKWILLGLVIAIALLQTLWRIVSSLSSFGPVYDAESTLEIVGSALFGLKLVLNSWLVEDGLRTRVMAYYVPAFVALCMNIGIAAGNLSYFAFTETTLGRFLQAIEFYILILFILISTFYKPSSQIVAIRRRVRPTSSFQGIGDPGVLPEMRASTFRVSPPTVSSPSTFVMVPQVQPSRQSSASRLSSWLMSRRGSLIGRSQEPQEQDQDRLWDRRDMEKGLSPDDGLTPSAGEETPSPGEPKQVAQWKDPVYTSIVKDTDKPAQNSDIKENDEDHPSEDFVPPSLSVSILAGVESNPPLEDDDKSPVTRPDSPIRTQSMIGPPVKVSPPEDEHPPSFLDVPQNTSLRDNLESPIYGLNGIIFPGGRSPSPHLIPGPGQRPISDISSLRSSGISNFLRQQEDLDRSIAQLRLFSMRSSVSPEPVTSDVEVDVDQSGSARSSGEGGLGRRKPDSASAPSEFSLSIFPEPPLVSGLASGVASARTSRSGGRVSVDNVVFDLEPPRLSAIAAEHRRQQSVPTSMRAGSIDSTGGARLMRPIRFDSQGTQYDVTSFIGHLTTPGHRSPQRSISSGRLTDIESEEEPPSAAIIAVTSPISGQAARPRLVVGSPPAARGGTVLSSAVIEDQISETRMSPLDLGGRINTSSQNASVEQQHVDVKDPASSPSLDNETPAVAASGLGGSGALRGRGKPIVGLPPRPRMAISGPRMRDGTDGQSALVSGEFERPRPAPLALKPSLESVSSVGTRNFGIAM